MFPVSRVCDVKCDIQKTKEDRLTSGNGRGVNRNLFSGFPTFKKNPACTAHANFGVKMAKEGKKTPCIDNGSAI